MNIEVTSEGRKHLRELVQKTRDGFELDFHQAMTMAICLVAMCPEDDLDDYEHEMKQDLIDGYKYLKENKGSWHEE